MRGQERVKVARACATDERRLLQVVGLSVVAAGGALLTDSGRVLLSRLLTSHDAPRQPLFYYVGLAAVCAGVVVAAGGVLGCWAASLHSRCFLAVYLFVLVLLLIAECSVGVLVTVCPRYLGVGLSAEDLMDNLQRYYATPGADQFTAAVDLAQAQLKCCGMTQPSDYEMSWWKLRDIGQNELIVPLSCCILKNKDDPGAFLDPIPQNNSLCQSVDETINNKARHTEGCSKRLEAWLKQHSAMFLAGSLTLVLVELSVVLSTLLVCVKLPRDPSHLDRPA
ncbi:CD82 antigen [Schistocerca cancellata]|uniref:CD82 antigen n=1 Tax=Schistocerca cancellata TaxID=274614 RepID=UPI0021197D0A|nr:CD82 antigen [Schistocerca cancellata]